MRNETQNNTPITAQQKRTFVYSNENDNSLLTYRTITNLIPPTSSLTKEPISTSKFNIIDLYCQEHNLNKGNTPGNISKTGNTASNISHQKKKYLYTNKDLIVIKYAYCNGSQMTSTKCTWAYQICRGTKQLQVQERVRYHHIQECRHYETQNHVPQQELTVATKLPPNHQTSATTITANTMWLYKRI